MKLEIVHADTCLPCYWSGHHVAHICVPVWHGMTLDQLKSELHSEISQGAVAGSDNITELLTQASWFSSQEIDAADKAAHDAVEEITVADGVDPECLFSYLDRADENEGSEYHDSVYAYFLILDTEND